MSDHYLEAAKALTGNAQEIAAGLNSEYSSDQLKRPLSTRMVHQLIGDVVAVAGARIKELEARLDALESADAYRGTHQRAMPYRRGSLVTHGGHLWSALKDVPEGVIPGTDPAAWQLAAKGEKPVVRIPAGGRKK